MKNIRRHEEKIEQENRKPEPNMRLVSKWERDIDRARAKVRQLEVRLEK